MKIFSNKMPNILQHIVKILKKYGQEALAVILLAAIVLTNFYFFPKPAPVFAATFNWLQTAWNGGLDGGVYPNHNSNQSNWTKYSAADANIATGTELALSAIADPTPETETADTDFASGTHSTTTVSGSGASAGVKLVSQGTWYNASWSKRRAITLSSSTTAANYQVKVTLSGVTLTDAQLTGGNANGNDIRFTGSDKITLQDYWIESWSAAGTTVTATIWVEVATSGESTIYMYYGNTGASAVTNGTNTFLLFDDFNDNSIDGSRWAAADSYGETVAETGSELKISGTGTGNGADDGRAGYLQSVSTYNNVAVDVQIRKASGSNFGGAEQFWSSSTAYSTYGMIVWPAFGDNGNELGFYNANLWCAVCSSNFDNTDTDTNFHTYSFRRINSSLESWRDGTQRTTATNASLGTAASNIRLTAWTRVSGDTVDVRFDNIRVRQYTSSEPTAAVGLEVRLYPSFGTFTSQIIDTGQINGLWGNAAWSASTSVPVNTGMTLKVRSCDDAACSGETAFSGITQSITMTNGAGSSALSALSSMVVGHRYVQYQVTLTSSDGLNTPTFADLTINSSYYSTSQTLTSSAYDTSDPTAIVNRISWTENAASGTNVRLQVRTAPDSGGAPDWTNGSKWCGPSSCAATASSTDYASSYYDTTPAGETLNSVHTTGANDRWIQYKVWLTSDSLYTPTLQDVSIQYVVNANPQFEAAPTVNLASSTQLTISYSVRDPDTDTGSPANQYKIWPSFEYSLNGGGSWTAISTSTLSASDYDYKTVATSTYNNYTATWNPKAQIDNTFSTNTKIRVTVNDHEGANNTAQASSTAFTLDTKDPAVSISALGIDSNAGTISYNFSATDDSTTTREYRISNNSDFSGASWQSFSATTVNATTGWSFTGAPSYERVYLAVRGQDAYGNITTVTASATVPYIPANFYYKDISNPAANDWREFISWGVYVSTSSAQWASYKIYRSTDGGVNYSLLTTFNSNVNTNYYTDTSVASGTTYYYKMLTVDTDGDISSSTVPVSDTPNGQGGSDLTAPVISNVQAAEAKSTWVRITWATDELSNSVVDYGLTNSYGSSKPVDTMVTSHSVTLTDLTPNTSYKFRVKSADLFTNQAVSDNSGLGYTAATTLGPVISDVSADIITDTTAHIVWNTNVPSDSWVYYSTSSAFTNPATFGTNVAVSTSTGGFYQHESQLTGLTRNTEYWFYVKSTDASTSEIATDNRGGSYYYFKTTRDTKPPVISNIATPVRTSAAIVITWETDELANSQVEFGTTSGSYSSTTALDSTLSIYHIVTLSGLSSETTYYYRVKSADSEGNSASSSEQTVQTTSALQTVTVTVVSGGGGGGMAGIAQNVYDKLKSDYDKLNKEYWDAQRELEKFKDTTPPTLSNIQVSGIEAFQAAVSWQTDEPSDGFVDYGETTDYNYNTGASDLTREHKIVLKRLKMGTAYHFRVSSQDKLSNMASSTDLTFTTLFAAEALEELVKIGDVEEFQQKLGEFMESVTPSLVPPVISDVKAEEVFENSAIVAWRTNVKSSSLVALAQEDEYKPGSEKPYPQEIGNSEEKETSHKVQLTNLIPDTLYNFQVKSQNSVGAVGQSKNFTFVTKSLPIKPRAIDITKNSMKVVWKTEKLASSIVEYKNLAISEILRKADDAKTTDHFVVLENLTPDTNYEIKVSGVDERNNLIESGVIRVRTSKDITPPVISSIKIDSTLVPGRTDRVQTIVRWLTNEAANSSAFYEEGSGAGDDLANKLEAADVFVQEHALIIPVMKPGTLYRLKIASTDEAGNQTLTPVRTIITPQYAQSIIDVVIKNFQETFKFLDKLR